MERVSLTLHEARLRARLISAISYDIELDLSTSPGDDDGRFGCRTSISFESTGPETFLELAHASDLRVSVNGVPVASPTYDGRRHRPWKDCTT